MENLELKVAKEVKKEEVENLVQETGKVTNEKIEESLNYDLLSQEEKDAIEEFNKKSKSKLPKLLIFIDEIEEIIKNKNYKKTENEFCRLLSRGRNVGIQFIMETKYYMDTPKKYGEIMFFLRTAQEVYFKKMYC